MPHTNDTCPVPNCPLCVREKENAESLFEEKATRKRRRPNKRVPRPIRDGFQAKAIRAMIALVKPRPTPKTQPTQRYLVREDQGFPGRWRAEPVNYTGRGLVYLFDTEAEAQAKAAEKNQSDGE